MQLGSHDMKTYYAKLKSLEKDTAEWLAEEPEEHKQTMLERMNKNYIDDQTYWHNNLPRECKGKNHEVNRAAKLGLEVSLEEADKMGENAVSQIDRLCEREMNKKTIERLQNGETGEQEESEEEIYNPIDVSMADTETAGLTQGTSAQNP